MSALFRRLFFDIETSPCILLAWGPGFKLSIPHENIVRERAIICIAWKWEDSKVVRCETWDKHQNDKAMLKQFVGVMHQADEIVGHNSDRFDTPWIRTRCLYHGIPMSPEFVSIDTLKAARSKFRFNSNRLDYLARFLLGDQKRPTGFDLWKRILLDKDPVALRKMQRYCKHDVRLLEQVFQKLSPFLPAKTHRAVAKGDEPRFLGMCPECASERTTINRYRTTAAGHRKVVYQCQDCGKYNTVAESRWLRAKKDAEEAAECG